MKALLITAVLTVPMLLVGCGSNPQLNEIEAARAQLRSERVQAEERAKQFDAQRRATLEELDHKLNLIRIAKRDFEDMVTAKTQEISALTEASEKRAAAAAHTASRTVDAMVTQRLNQLRMQLLELRGDAANGGSSESLQKLLKSLEARDRLANHVK